MTKPTTPSSFVNTADVRSKLDRLFIVRVNPDLFERIDDALQHNPTLAGLSRSAFARKAILCALDALVVAAPK